MLVLPRFDPAVEGVVRLGIVQAARVHVGPSGPELVRERERLVEEIARLDAAPGLAPARELYRRFGIDPTRHRPSSEALFRRARAGKPLPWISNAVDWCNLCSLRTALPIGLYDVDAIRGQVVVRRGAAGEAYAGIRKDEVHVGGRPVLADEVGPFGNPSSDSLRTAVGPATTRLLMVLFAPSSVTHQDMEEHLRFAAAGLERHLGAGRTPAVEAAVLPLPGRV